MPLPRRSRERAKVATVAQHVYAIRRFHASSGLLLPIGADVRAILAGLRRIRGSEHRPKAAITPDELARMIAAIDPEGKRGARDAAVLLFGFAAGLRRADLVALDLADLEFADRGILVRVGRNRREKNDQAGRGRDVPIFRGKRRETCPVLAVERWLRFRSRKPGPLFTRCDRGAPELARLSAHAVRLIVRSAAAAIGLEPASYGAHSLRAGMITACAAGGASDSTIMQRSGHATVEMVKRYRRHADLFHSNPLAALL